MCKSLCDKCMERANGDCYDIDESNKTVIVTQCEHYKEDMQSSKNKLIDL